MKKLLFVGISLLIVVVVCSLNVSASTCPCQGQMSTFGNQIELGGTTSIALTSAGALFYQSFRTNESFTATRCSLLLGITGTWTGRTERFGIQLVNVSGVPDGTWIASKNQTPISGWNMITFDSSKSLSDNTVYAIVMSDTGSNLAVTRQVTLTIGNSYSEWHGRPSNKGDYEGADSFGYKTTGWARGGYMMGWGVHSSSQNYGNGYATVTTHNVYSNYAVKQQIVNVTSDTYVDGVDLYVTIPTGYLVTQNLNVEIRYNSNDSILTSGSVNGKSMNILSNSPAWAKVSFSSPVWLRSAYYYYLKVWSNTGSGASYTLYAVNCTNGNSTSYGLGYGKNTQRLFLTTNNGTSWTGYNAEDLQFRIHKITPLTVTNSNTYVTGSSSSSYSSYAWTVTNAFTSSVTTINSTTNATLVHQKAWTGSTWNVWGNASSGILTYENLVNTSGTHQKVWSSALGKYKVWANYTTGILLYQNIVNASGNHQKAWDSVLGKFKVWANYTGSTTPIHTSDTKTNCTGSLGYVLNSTGYWVTSVHSSNLSLYENIVNSSGTHVKVWDGSKFKVWANYTTGILLYQNIVNATGTHQKAYSSALGKFKVWANYTGNTTPISIVDTKKNVTGSTSYTLNGTGYHVTSIHESTLTQFLNLINATGTHQKIWTGTTWFDWANVTGNASSCGNTSLTFITNLSNVNGSHNSSYNPSSGWTVWLNYTGNTTNVTLYQNLGSNVFGTHEKGLYADGWHIWANYSAFIPQVRTPETNIYDPNPANNTYVIDFGNTSAGFMNNNIEQNANGLNTSVYIKFKNVGVDTDMVQYAVNGSYGDGNYQFYDPWGVCSDGTYIWIVDRLNQRIIKRFAQNLTYIANISSLGYFGDPTGIAVDDNYIYVADKTYENIKRFFKGNLNYDKQYNYLWQVSAVCVNDTYLWNFDLDHNRLVKRWKSNGTIQTYIGSTGGGNDEFDTAYGLCITPDNRYLFIADTLNHRIVKRWAGNLTYISESGNSGLPGLGPNEYQYPGGVTCDNSYVWIADTENHRIVKRNVSTFAYIAESGEAGVAGTDANHYDGPIGIAHSEFSDYLWITEANNNRVNVRYDTAKLTVNVTFLSNSSGSWQRYGPKRTTILTNSVVGQWNKNFTGNNTRYWWMVSMEWGALIKSYYNQTFVFKTSNISKGANNLGVLYQPSLWFKCDDVWNKGTIVLVNDSTYGINGTGRTGVIPGNSTTLPEIVKSGDSVVNKSFYFNSTNSSYISVNYTVFNSFNYTLSLWVKCELPPTGSSYIFKMNNLSLWIADIDGIHFTYEYDTWNKDPIPGSSGFHYGTWYHFIIFENNSDAYVYVNGELDAYTNHFTPMKGNPNLGLMYFGKDVVLNTSSYKGFMDEIKLYTRCLNYTEIQMLFFYENPVTLSENILNATGTHVKKWYPTGWHVWANYTGNGSGTTPIHISDTKKNVTGNVSYILNGTGYWVTSVHESKLMQFLNLVNATGTHQKSWNGSVWLDWANITGNASNASVIISGKTTYIPVKNGYNAEMLVPLSCVALIGGLLGVRRRRRVK